MSWSSKGCAALNRGKGERYDSWMRRNHEYHITNWMQHKKATGEWLLKEMFESLTGRKGR